MNNISLIYQTSLPSLPSLHTKRSDPLLYAGLYPYQGEQHLCYHVIGTIQIVSKISEQPSKSYLFTIFTFPSSIQNTFLYTKKSPPVPIILNFQPLTSNLTSISFLSSFYPFMQPLQHTIFQLKLSDFHSFKSPQSISISSKLLSLFSVLPSNSTSQLELVEFPSFEVPDCGSALSTTFRSRY